MVIGPGVLQLLREELHLSYEDFLGLGRVNAGDAQEPYCMTVLALKMGRHANGVSALHGQVSRQMWHPLYPNRPEEEVPIGHITNGVHVRSWVAPPMHRLFDRHLITTHSHAVRSTAFWTTNRTTQIVTMRMANQLLLNSPSPHGS